MAYHQCHSVSGEAVREEFGELTVSVWNVAVAFLGVAQRSNAVALVG